MQTASGTPDSYARIELVELKNFVLSTFPGKEELKEERNRKLCNPNPNHAVKVKDRR